MSYLGQDLPQDICADLEPVGVRDEGSGVSGDGRPSGVNADLRARVTVDRHGVDVVLGRVVDPDGEPDIARKLCLYAIKEAVRKFRGHFKRLFLGHKYNEN